jgi:hypothetical protein
MNENMKRSLLLAMIIALCLSMASINALIFKSQISKEKIVVKIEEPVEIEECIVVEEELSNELKKSIELCKKEYSQEIAKSIQLASKKYNIPIYVLYAIIATESGEFNNKNINLNTIGNLNKEACSGYNCIGLMQVSKYALKDYNKYNRTNYNLMDLYSININIEVGTWFYSQFKAVSSNYIEQYVIYNVGYGEFNKKNKNSFYGYDNNWKSNYRNSYFYLNGVLPPKDSRHGMYGKNKLPKYAAKERFELCLKICEEYFSS